MLFDWFQIVKLLQQQLLAAYSPFSLASALARGY